ncbi:MAG: DUF1974 domain-containing protein, partial [Candidatus Methylomirabilis sp.]|nr:DUF1974 domain-containing protein [Deltaproteobacteria bacterium]
EGIEEPLARIGGYTYWMNAARRLTVGSVDNGEKPSVLSAIVKAYTTEGMRLVVNDGMDVIAGAGISRGPRNVLARAYLAAPIGITVEGANILTRSMIIFGQGAIRGHRHARYEMEAVAKGDVALFDEHFWSHVGLVFSSAVRSVVLAVTGGAFAGSPDKGPLGGFYGKLTRMSASFAFMSDVLMASLGGDLKRKEKLSGRLADALAWMYIGSATLKRFSDEGHQKSDLPFAEWSVRLALHKVQEAFVGVIENVPNPLIGLLLRATVFPVGARLAPPSDELGAKVAQALLDDHDARRRLTADIYIPPVTEPGLGRLELALQKVLEAGKVIKTIRKAVHEKKLPKAPLGQLVDKAVEAGIISDEDRKRLGEAEAAREEA